MLVVDADLQSKGRIHMARRKTGSRRANGEGTKIYMRKDGRPECKYTIQTVDGPKRKTLTGKKGESREDLASRLRKILVDTDGRIVDDSENLTVAEYLERWLEDSVRDNVTHRTESNYRLMVRGHIVPAFGTVKLARLTPVRLQGLYRRLQDEDKHATARYVHATLHRALGQALRWGIVDRNPAELVTPPLQRKSEVAALTRDEAERLLREARESGDRLEALYVLAIHTGMRQGEMLGLRWTDIDLSGDAPSLRVARQLQRSREGGGLVFTQTKTKKGRYVSLGPTVVAALRRHWAYQTQEKLHAGALYEDQGLVFASEIGTPLEASNMVRRSFKPLLRRAGLPRIRFQDLRHTCATLLLISGVHPKFVQELLGHSSISVTLDIYSHMLPAMGAVAQEAMERTLAPQEEAHDAPGDAPFTASLELLQTEESDEPPEAPRGGGEQRRETS